MKFFVGHICVMNLSKKGAIMVKEKIKSVAAVILSTAFVAISAMGLVACARENEENAPSSFVCPETNLTIELSKDKSYYIVTDCPEEKTEVVIMESYYGKPVKEIGENAFDGCENLTKVSIPDCMISINPTTLSACKKLEYTETGDAKYLGNENNPYVYLAKYLSEDFEAVVVESNCKAIGDRAFYGCGKLKSVSLPDGLASIGSSAFSYCRFTSIKLPASLTNIGVGAFAYCQSLESVTIPNGVTEISAHAFKGCYRLGNVRLRENLTKIWEFAFAESGLNRVTIPDGVTSIGFNAFAGCGKLMSVSIPASVTGIGSNAFSYCSDLTTIRFNGTKAQWEKVKKGSMWDFYVSAKAVSCTDGAVSLSKNNS